MRKLLLLLLCFLQVLCMTAQQKIRVACVGNSVTYGTGLADRAHDSYPVQLQEMLGDQYEVKNFGHPSTTLCNQGRLPYTKVKEYHEALEYKPDMVVIHLGLNDTDPQVWANYADEFVPDYHALIDTFRNVNPKAKIWVCRMTPIFHQHRRFQSSTRNWHAQIQQRIEQVSMSAKVGLIDLYAPLHCHPELFPDALHPNPEGAGILAKQVYGALTGNYGGLQLPETYGDGMILQREKPIVFKGLANAGEPVTVKFNKSKRKVTAKEDGTWKVTFPEEAAGGPYTLDIETFSGKRTIDDIWVGEVWLCSGQSNMAFRLKECLTAKNDLAECAKQKKVHIFHKKMITPPTNMAWEESILNYTNQLRYLLPGKWQACNAENLAEFSAIAYHFGRILADSLNCHVGLICNPVGASSTEAWIDRTTLEKEYPVILEDWKKNEHTNSEVRNRSIRNLKNATNPLQRHPNQPAYLFESGILPLKDYAIRGVIWYQGEANSHNVELHERFFRLLVGSWRQFWNDDKLPFHFVQLSSLDSQKSWPLFRDSQRRLAKEIDNTWMTVSSDLGNRNNIHPNNKAPIGYRLVQSALYHTYGKKNIIPSGPDFQKAEYYGGKIHLTFAYGEDLHPAKGKEIIGFEVAGINGTYYPAQVKVNKDGIEVSSKKVKDPQSVRYGWQPYTEANLVNKANLPCSTFRHENFAK